MHWLVIILLAVLVFRQGQAIRRLEDRLSALLRGRPEAPDAPPESARTPPPSTAPVSLAEAQPAARAVAPETTIGQGPRFKPQPPPRQPVPPPPPPRPQPQPQPQPLSSSSPVRTTRTAVSTWLAENGLAWIGGGGLALGGLLLVVYAAQRGVFTPPLRIAAAVVLGGLMIAASEWILRQKQAPGGRHLLAAAVAAGAGAVTLYGAVCAAHALYGLIPFPAAAMLTAAVSLGLLGLALRHGEALALLAVFGAVITPWVTGIDAWPSTTLQAYAVLIGVTGFAISAVRLWGRASFVTTAGLLAWSLSPAFDGGAVQMVLAAVGPVCATLWRRARRQDDPAAPGASTFLQQPAIALVLTSLASAHLWSVVTTTGAFLPEAALTSGVLAALGAAMVVLGMAEPVLFAVPVGMAVFGATAAVALNAQGPGFTARLPWIHGLTGLIPVAALAGALRSPPPARTVLLSVGGVGVAIMAGLAWPLLRGAGLELTWLPAAFLAGAMFAAGALIARRVEQVRTDAGLRLWLAAAAALTFLAVHAAVPAHLEPAAFAATALLLALAAGRLAWSGLAQASVVGGLVAVAALFRPAFMGAALDGRLSLSTALAVSIGASALLFAAARLVPAPGSPNRNEAEALTTASLMVLLTGLFIGLHVILAGADGDAGAGGLFEAALRTLLLLSAGLLLTARRSPDEGPIARWRAVVAVGAGVAYGLLAQGLAWNPWWGEGAPPVGPVIVNTLIVAFLAPALLLAATAWRRRPADGWTRAWAAAGVLFAFLWALLALRHLFQGADMGTAGVGRAEACAYAVLLLLTARAFAPGRFEDGAGPTAWLRRAVGLVGAGDRPNGVGSVLGWLALGFASLVFGLYASPWWGPQTEPLASVPSAVLLFGLYGLGALAAASLRPAPGALGKAATACVVGILFALVTLLIRWSFHGADMSGVAPGGGRLETWTFSALWAAFGLATLSLGAARRDVTLRWAGLAILFATAVKVLLFDLARLDGVIRAASFLAVGALFLVAALAARRLNNRPAAGAGREDAADKP